MYKYFVVIMLLVMSCAKQQSIFDPQPVEQRTGRVIATHRIGYVELQDGIVIKYAGIKMPTYHDSKYAAMVMQLSNKLILLRLIRYELTGKITNNVPEAYIYIEKTCINSELVRRGYAIADREDTDRAKKLIALEKIAEKERRGLWAYKEDNPFKEPLY